MNWIIDDTQKAAYYTMLGGTAEEVLGVRKGLRDGKKEGNLKR